MIKNLETKYYHTLTNDNGMTILFITYQMFAVVQKNNLNINMHSIKYWHTQKKTFILTSNLFIAYGRKNTIFSSLLSSLYKVYKYNVKKCLNKRRSIKIKKKYFNGFLLPFINRVDGYGLTPVSNNISAISLWSALLVEETGVPGENHRPVTIHNNIIKVLCFSIGTAYIFVTEMTHCMLISYNTVH